MNKNGSGAFRKPESYTLPTDLTHTTPPDAAEQSVKSLVPAEATEPAVSLQPTPEQQGVAAAHPVGEIIVEPADAVSAPLAPPRRIRPRVPHPRISPRVMRPHIPHPHIPHPRIRARMPHMRPMRVHTFDSFRYVGYRFLWASTLFFSGAFWLQQVVIGWLTYRITESALLTSVAMGLDALPILLAGPLGGLLVDRWNKRKLLAGVFVYQALLASGFGALALLGEVNAWHIFGFVFLMGVSWVITDPARMTLIPATVPRHNLVNAFALNSLAFSLTRLAIPAVGGALLAFAGAGAALLLEGAIMACAAVVILGLRVTPSVPKSRLSARGAIADILEGARYIREHSVVLGLLLFGFLPAVLVSPFMHGLIPVYAAEVFGVGPTRLGLLMSAVGAGFVIGTLTLASVGDVARKGWIIFGSIALCCASMAAFALNPSIALAYPLAALGSVGTMAFFSVTGATMQSVLPDDIRGRVSGIYILTFGAMPLGSLAAGAIAQRMGAPAATLIACALVAVAALALALKFPSIRNL